MDNKRINVRIEIKVEDKLGISQEILSIFAQRNWNILALEVGSHFIYVHFMSKDIGLPDIKASLKSRTDIIHCKTIDLLPTERRELHLQTLLDKLPNPIIDIDERGLISAVNKATIALLAKLDIGQVNPNNSHYKSIVGQPIAKYSDYAFTSINNPANTSVVLSFMDNSYVADITCLNIDEKISGVMLTLRSMHSVGQQISLLQAKEQAHVDNIIGNSSIIVALKAQTIRFAKLELPVLISGETGTGKELVARALHNASSRSQAPFLAINCAALPEHLLESELFGYASGAFTGAKKGGKPGLLELAESGSLFLDEIAEMSTYLQAKLLRFLQDYNYRRLGGTKELTANVRIISASHQNLTKLIEQRLFREDLYYRLNVLGISIPPLRERSDDISLLAQHFIESAALQVSRSLPVLTEQGLTLLKSYYWPGNIRQLQNILFRAVALNESGIIDAKDVDSLLSEISSYLPQSNQKQLGHGIENNVEGSDRQSIDNTTGKNDEGHDSVLTWKEEQQIFEQQLLSNLYENFPTTRKLAERLNVSHNKIAMKLRQYNIGN
jgi:TyrR family helix-turn-helix protein